PVLADQEVPVRGMGREDREGGAPPRPRGRELPLQADAHELRVEDLVPHVHRDDVEELVAGALCDPAHLRRVRGVLPLNHLEVGGGPPVGFLPVHMPVLLEPPEVERDVAGDRGPRHPAVLPPALDRLPLELQDRERPRHRAAPGARSFSNVIHTGCFTKPRASLMLRIGRFIVLFHVRICRNPWPRAYAMVRIFRAHASPRPRYARTTPVSPWYKTSGEPSLLHRVES